MILIEFKDNNTKYLCSECNRIIATGKDFLLELNDFPGSRIKVSGDKINYICICGSKYELIQSSNPDLKNFFKFKHVRVVEQGYVPK